MPQPSKKNKNNRKGRLVKSASRSHRTLYLLVAVIGVIIAASAAWYVYSSEQNTATTSAPTVSSTSSTSDTTGLVYAKIDTSQGLIEVELFQSLTPKTVDNFVSLANLGFYNNLVWHRIVKQSGFEVIQTGDPTSRKAQGSPCGWGDTSSSQTVPLEIVPSLHNDVGYLGMAHSSDVNSGSSQFYINLTNNTSSLDGNYTVFGKVISGLNVAQSIDNLAINPSCQRGPTDGPPETPSQAMVISITIQSSP